MSSISEEIVASCLRKATSDKIIVISCDSEDEKSSSTDTKPIYNFRLPSKMNQDSSTNREELSSCLDPSSPNRREVLPNPSPNHLRSRSPNWKDSSPNRRAISPNCRNTSQNNLRSLSPNWREPSPNGRNTLQNNLRSLSPNWREPSPNGRNPSPSSNDLRALSPNWRKPSTNDLPPPSQDLKSTTKDLKPTTKDLRSKSPNWRAPSSNSSNLSPRERSRSTNRRRQPQPSGGDRNQVTNRKPRSDILSDNQDDMPSASGYEGDMEILDSSNFSRVLDSATPWLVMFSAPWCGPCRKMKPAFQLAATKLKGKVRLGFLNGDLEQNQDLVRRFAEEGFPSLYHFPANGGTPEMYGGGRKTEEIVKWARAFILA